jgi:hypothetical protein
MRKQTAAPISYTSRQMQGCLILLASMVWLKLHSANIDRVDTAFNATPTSIRSKYFPQEFYALPP